MATRGSSTEGRGGGTRGGTRGGGTGGGRGRGGQGRGGQSRGGWNSRAQGDRGRGGRGGRGRGQIASDGHPSQALRTYQPPRPPISRSSEPLGECLDSINIKTLLVDEESPRIENCEYVASYNWMNGKDATILIPGSPPAWTPPATDTKLDYDSEAVFRDTNAAQWPQHPLEPAVRSLRIMRPTFELASVDLFGCGHTLGYLLKACRSDPTPFRFDVDVVGDTVFFVRKCSSPTERIQDLRGFGFRFPATYTTWESDVLGSTSHQRTINYSFGGLQILLRSGTDGYVPRGAAHTSRPEGASPPEDALKTLNVGGTDLAGKQGELRVENVKGRLAPQSDIFDIKTRSISNPIQMEDVLPGLWLNQTPNLLVAYHRFGLFDQPKIKTVRPDILEWEKENAHLLATFHAIVKRIIDVVRDSEKQQCEVSWEGTGELLLTEQIGEGRRALPTDLQQLFAGE